MDKKEEAAHIPTVGAVDGQLPHNSTTILYHTKNLNAIPQMLNSFLTSKPLPSTGCGIRIYLLARSQSYKATPVTARQR